MRRHVVTDRRKPVVEKPSKGPHSSPTNATRTKIIKPWHTSLAPGEGARAWIEETFEAPEADYQESPITVIQRGSPLAQNPELESYDDLFGTADESLTIRHACTSHPAPLSADPGDIEPSHCLSCSANTIVHRHDRVETTRQLAKRPPALLARNTTSIAWNAPSPSSILSSGRSDPFSPFVGAGSRVHELIDHCTYSGFVFLFFMLETDFTFSNDMCLTRHIRRKWQDRKFHLSDLVSRSCASAALPHTRLCWIHSPRFSPLREDLPKFTSDYLA